MIAGIHIIRLSIVAFLYVFSVKIIQLLVVHQSCKITIKVLFLAVLPTQTAIFCTSQTHCFLEHIEVFLTVSNKPRSEEKTSSETMVSPELWILLKLDSSIFYEVSRVINNIL